jgi:hypothetical protein
MKPTKNDQSEWAACQPGEVDQLVNRMRSTSRRQQVRELAIITTASLLFVAAGLTWYGVGSRSNSEFGGMVCAEVMEVARQYVLNDLTAEQTKQVDAHLAHCKDCATKIENMRQNEGPSIPEEVLREKPTFDNPLADQRPLEPFEIALAASY